MKPKIMIYGRNQLAKRLSLDLGAYTGIPVYAIGVCMLLIKVFYLLIIDEQLPEDYMLWTFHKDVHFEKVPFELFFFFVALFTYLKLYKRNFFGIFMTLVFVISFVPANSGLSLSNDSYDFYILNNLYAYFLIMVTGLLCVRYKQTGEIKGFDINNVFSRKKNLNTFRVFLLLFVGIVLYRVYLINGLDIGKIFVSQMYDVRAEYAETYSSQTNTMFSYLSIIIGSFSSWFVPIYLYISIRRKMTIDIIVGLFVLLALFSVSMQKSTLFILVVVVYVAWASKKQWLSSFAEHFIYAIAALFIISFIEYSLYGESIIFSMVIRRIFYVPNYMINIHYEFFSDHPKLGFTQDCFFVQNILQRIVPREYAFESVKVISENCFDGLLPAPNAGLFAEAFAQLGIIGLFVFPFIHIGIVRYVVKYTSWYGMGISIIILVKLYLSMMSVYILASAYSVGILIFIFTSIFIKKVIVKPTIR